MALTSITSRLIIIFIFSLALSCSQDLPDQLIESEHFRYHYREGDEPCSGIIPRIEHHYEVNTSFLGIKIPTGSKIDYYKYRDISDAEKNACNGDSQCTRGTKVYSSNLIAEFELLRAYTYHLGKPPSFFQEGVAKFLSCNFFLSMTVTVCPEIPIEELMVSKAFKFYQYSTGEYIPVSTVASSFTMYLLDEYGPEPWRRFYSTVPHDSDFAKISSYFEDAFGTGLDASISEWKSTLPKTAWESVACLQPCDNELLSFDVNNPTRKEGTIFCLPDNYVFETTIGDDIEISLEEMTDISIYPCVGNGVQSLIPPYLINTPSMSWIKLEPGRYFLDIWPDSHASESKPYSFIVHKRDNLFGETCENSVVQIIPPDLTTLYIFAGNLGTIDDYPNDEIPGAGDRVVRFEVTEPRKFRLFSANALDRSYLTICTGGCPGDALANCTNSLMYDYQLFPGQVYSLVIDSIPEKWKMYKVMLVFDSI